MRIIHENWRTREEGVAEGLVEKKRYSVSFEVQAEARELSDEDRRFFVGAEEERLLPENTEELSACFDSRIGSASFEELA
jgi:hypothetical protein